MSGCVVGQGSFSCKFYSPVVRNMAMNVVNGETEALEGPVFLTVYGCLFTYEWLVNMRV